MSNVEDLELYTDEEAFIVKQLLDAEKSILGEDPPVTESKKPENKDYLLAIYDDLLTKGEYIGTFQVAKGINVVWKSRTLGEANTIARIIDSASFSTVIAVQNHTNTLNMACSLVALRGKSFKDAKLGDKRSFLETLPEVLIMKLSESLSKFDRKVAEAVEYGKENF